MDLINSIYHEDARKINKFLKQKNLIKTTITSPPYYDMKDYGSDNQIGFGQSYEEYLNDLKTVFENIYTITREDGTLWIIIDTFKKDGRVIPLPFDLVSKLITIGWLLQDVIIWKKDKTVPWSSNGFVQRKFEYILFFSKSKDFAYYKDRVRVYDTSHLKKWWVKYPERYNPKGKALDEVWEYAIPTQGSWGDKYIRHFCPLPKDMVGTMIQLTTNEEDVVLDPFSGSGSVLSQAAYMKRNYIGFELNQSYIEMFKQYIENTLENGIKKYELFNSNNDQHGFENTILDLRALKYAKLITKHIKSKFEEKNVLIIAVRLKESGIKHKIIQVKYQIIGNFIHDEMNNLLKEITTKAPMSKFGIEPIFEYFKELPKDFSNQTMHGYTETNTYCTQGIIRNQNIQSNIKIISSIKVELNENDYE